jgi:hypothetical protein
MIARHSAGVVDDEGHQLHDGPDAVVDLPLAHLRVDGTPARIPISGVA